MGTWGTVIFSNDVASDVRSTYRELLGQGLSTEAASSKVIDEFCVGSPENVDNNDVWLALADTQHRTGHIAPQVINRAISITTSDEELERWEPAEQRSRSRALVKLRDLLNQEPPEPRVIRAKKFRTTSLQIGQHQVFRDEAAGSSLLLRVVVIAKDVEATYPVYTVLDWDGTEEALRDPADLPMLRRAPGVIGAKEYFAILATGRISRDRLQTLEPASDPATISPELQNYFSFMRWNEVIEHVRLLAARKPATLT